MSEREYTPNASHTAFPYFFTSYAGVPTEGIFMTADTVVLEIVTTVYMPIWKDLKIYYDTLTDDDFVSCGCSRWTVDNYSIVVETVLNDEEVTTLKNNMVPGAVKEMYSVLGLPHFYDLTFTGDNTLRFVPDISSNSNLPYMRNSVVVYPKNIVTSPIEGASGRVRLKIEAYTSSSTEL
jgi:hypothetical protein